MTITVWFSESRLPFLLKEINESKVTVVDEPDSDGTVQVELIIENSFDVLKIFHAGLEAGWND